MLYTQQQIDQANQTDLAEFLLAQGEELIRAGKEVRWKAHNSVTIRGNQWFRHSENVGGYPVDFVMKFYGLSFSEAVDALIHQKGDDAIINKNDQNDSARTAADLPTPEETQAAAFILPPAAENNRIVEDYLIRERGLDQFTVSVFEKCGMQIGRASCRERV